MGYVSKMSVKFHMLRTLTRDIQYEYFIEDKSVGLSWDNLFKSSSSQVLLWYTLSFCEKSPASLHV